MPGNHDRYTSNAVRSKIYESYFGEFAPRLAYPWLRPLDARTALLGLDPTRSHISATGYLPPEQLAEAKALIADPESRPPRLIVACHYPLIAPRFYQRELDHKRLKNAAGVRSWLAGIGPHVYCCGHVHAAWAFVPPELTNQVCLNSGAPLLRDPTGFNLPGFLEIELEDSGITVFHHAWTGVDWMRIPLFQDPHLFSPPEGEAKDREAKVEVVRGG